MSIVDNTVVNFTRSNMYWIFVLLQNFHLTKSAELMVYEPTMQALDSESLRVNFQPTNSAELWMYELTMQALDSNSLIIDFHIQGALYLLNGLFTAHHQECHPHECGSTHYQTQLFHEQKISIRANLSPCNKHFGIEVRSHTAGGWYYYEKLDWIHTGRIFQQLAHILPYFFFPDFSFCVKPTTATVTTPTTTSTPNSTTNASFITTATFFTEHNYQNSIILGASLLVVIISVPVIMFLICKRRRRETQKRNEEMDIDENHVYGIYDDGPMYNVVTDENDYYSS